MTTPADHRGDDYLWDRSGSVDPAVADLERRLAPLAYDAAIRPLALRARGPRRLRIVVLAGTIAASLVLAAGFWFYHWRLEWPADRAWTMLLRSTGETASSQLQVGQPLAVPSPTSARIDVARLGTIDAVSGTELTLSATDSNHHRVQLTRGTVDVRLWAPPGAVSFRTPAGDVIDLGCFFQLAVDADGIARLAVRSGWVKLDNAFGESLVPAGASSLMQSDRRPFVPVYDDAAPAFGQSVRAFERADTTEGQILQLPTIARQVRERDVVTLLMLAARVDGNVRSQLLDVAAKISPPPAALNLKAAAAGDNEAVWKWIDALALPPVKGWWRNWRDAFPRSR
jgi:hypothetical protein